MFSASLLFSRVRGFMPALMTAVLLLTTTSAAFAQVSLTATAGTTSASYTTLGAAFSAINLGTHQGVIGITITGTTSEGATSAVLNASGSGAASYTAISIAPGAGVAGVIAGGVTGPLVDLNGASHVTIDGLNAGGSSLRIENTAATTTSAAIRFINGASSNSIQNCTINGAGTATTIGVITFAGTTGATGNSSNLVTACDIGPSGASLPMVGVYSAGTTTSVALYNTSNTLSNNRIHDYFSTTAAASVYGIELLTGNTDWTISGNSIYQSATRSPVTTGTMYGIYVVNATNGNNFSITGNFVGGTAASAGGTALTVNAGTLAYIFTGIYTSATSASVQGNTITNFVWTSGGSPVWRGIFGTTATGATLNIGTVTGNTIGSGTGTGAITLTVGIASGVPSGIDVGGSGTVNVSNNTIGSITGTGTFASFTGLNSTLGVSASGGTGTFGGNLIGSLTTAGSISMTTASASAGQITGISLTGVPPSPSLPLVVSGNTIANLSSAAVTAFLRSVQGILVNPGNTSYHSIIGNTIRNLSSAATGTSTTPSSAPIAGIAMTTTFGNFTVSQNTIHSLASTSPTGQVCVEGIGISAGTSAGSIYGTVSRNFIHSLSAVSSATCTIVGIAPTIGATVRYANNMVRLGVDANGASVTGPHTFVGIGDGISGNAFYFNTVWIGGTATGAANTYAFYRATALADTLKDNIFTNLRTGGTGRQLALSVNGFATRVADYNLYWSGGGANLVSVDNAASSLNTLQAIRAVAAGWEAHSGLGDPQLVAPAAAAGSVNLKLQPFTPAEGSGVVIAPAVAGLTDIDEEGDLRASNTPADIGADAGLYAVSAATDAFPPVITVTPLANTSSTGDRTLTATITDVGAGVPTSGTLVPRVWFRKVGTLPWFSAPGTLASGTGTNGTWNFTVSGTTMGLASGDFAEYYVVAQDQATTPNLWYSPVTGTTPVHTDVNTQVTGPATTLSYQVIGAYAGTYYVPSDPGGQASHTFATLTATSGLFAAINGGTLSGNVTVVINGDVSIETGTNALNQWLEDGAGGWTFTIQPDGTTLRTVSGTVATAGAPLISFNGADRVTIDGNFGGSGQYLRFRNTNATAASCGPTIQFNNGATFGALKNSIVESNATTATTGEVLIGATGVNNNFTISGNDLRDATGGTIGSPANAIYGNSANISLVTISNNTIHNFGNFGVDFGGTTYNAAQVVGSGVTVSGNSFYFDGVTPGAYQCAIGIGGAGDGHVVSGNFIGGKAPSCGGAAWSPATAATVYGIGVSASGATTGTSIQGNTIQNWAINTSLSTFYGISATNGKFSIGTVTGNVIGHATTAGSIGITSTTAAAVYGINATGSSVVAQNNLVANLTGTGVSPYLRGMQITSTGAASCQNNAVRNVTLPGTSANSSFGISVSGTGPFDVGGTTGNTVSNLGLAVTALSYGINVTSTSTTGNVVSHNSVTGITSSGTGAYYGLSIASPYNATSSTIQGNTVQGLTVAGTEFRGISAAGNPGATNGFGPASMTGNLVGSDTAPGSITVSGTGATSGIWLEGYGNSFSSLDDLSSCTIANLTASGTGAAVSLRGIYVAQASASVSGGYVGMSNVNIHDLQTASTNVGDGATAPAVVGIWLLGAQAPYVQNSSIHGLRSTTSAAAATAVDGIWATGGIGTIQRNRIWDLTSTSTSAGALVRGVYQFGGTWTLSNNEVTVTNGANTNPVLLQGVVQNLGAGIGSANLYYNSVYVGGSQASGASSSHAFLRQAGFVDALFDNVFLNARANTGSSTGSHYALGSTLAGGWTSNYNVFVASAAGTLGQWSGSDATLSTWRTASSGDANSLGETSANVPAAQLFSDPANGVLDIKATTAYDVPPIVSNAGAPVAGVASDFGGVDVRNAATPDVGADEITVSRTLTAAGTLPPASPAYAGNYDDLAISGAGTPTLSGNVNVFGALTLGGGNFTTGPNSVTIAPTGSVARTSGSVVGTMRKYFPVSASSATNFEVGSGADYAYLRVTLAPVSTAGYVSATTVGTEHPQIASSTIDPTHDANRYWSLAGNGVAFGTASVTPHFVSTDLDAGADPLNFRAARYDGSAWTLPTVGTRTSTSTQVTGLTSLGDLAVGMVAPMTITATAGAGGGISPAGAVSVPYGGNQTFTITPVAPNHVADVLVDGVSVGAVTTYAFTNVTAAHTISATFSTDTYTITASSGADGHVTPAGVTTLSYGGSQTYTITAEEHHHVADVLVDGVSVGVVGTYAFTSVTANHTISASFAIDTNPIVATSGTGGTVTPAGTTNVGYNLSQAYTITPAAHYQVADVLVDGASVGAVTTYTFSNVTASHTISATFTIDTNAIVATSGANGSVTPAGTTQVLYDGSQAYAIAGDAGYDVADVLVDGVSIGAVTTYTFSNVTAPHTISATFAISTYTLAASSTAGGSISPAGVTTVDWNGSQGYTLAADPDYVLVALLVDGASVGTPASYTFSNVTANHTISAQYQLIMNPAPVSAGSPAGTLSGTTSTLTVPVTISRNYANTLRLFHVTFQLSPELTLTGGTGGITEGGFLHSGGDATTFQILDNGGGSYSADGSVLGSTCNVTALTGTLFNIAVSSSAPTGPGAVTITGVTLRDCANTTLPSAVGSAASVAIDNGAPSVSLTSPVGGEFFAAGSPQTITWTATDNVGVSGVDLALSLDGGATWPTAIASGIANSGSYAWTVPATLSTTARVRVTAHDAAGNAGSSASPADFTIGQYTVTLTAASGGSINPNTPQSLSHGASLAFTVTANAGYHIASVLDGATELGTGGSYTLTNVTANHTITATFAIDQYTVTLSAGPGGSINPNTPQTVNHGSDFSFTVTADPGYHVASVLDGATELGAGGSYTLTNVIANHTITATFAINQFIVTLNAGTGGSINPNTPQTVNYGSDLSFTVTADAGYHIAGVLDGATDLGAGGSYTLTNVTANHTITASFAVDQYTITVSAGANGSISPAGPVTLNVGGSQTFTITPIAGFHVGTLTVDGIGQPVTVGVMTYSFTGVTANHSIAATFAANPAVPAIASLAAAQMRSGNVPGNTTRIQVSWPGAPAGTIEVYRAPFGNYPLYAAGGSPGSVPAVPASYPPAGWTLTGVHHSGEMDLPATRDFYYYVAYVTDSYGTVSPVSNRTGGTLDYHLGDVSNGSTLGVGDAHVTIADLSLLGSHYGSTGVGATIWNYIDVGPTTDLSISSMPTADGKLNFEDLAMFGINFEAVSAPQFGNEPVAAATDELSFEAQEQVTRGDVVTLRLRLSGTGAVHALSAALGWDSGVVAPAGFEAGSMVSSQGGVMFSAAPGSVDGVVLGSDRSGFLGEGEFATLTFTALRDGSPGFTFSGVDARNGVNAKIGLATSSRVAPHVPIVTSLSNLSPNPAPGGTTVAFGLSKSSPVDLALYSVDGRRVRMLAHGQHAANTYRISWDGRDDAGRKLAAGVYYARLTTAQGAFTKSVVLIP